MNDEIDRLKAEIAELKSEVDDIKIALHNRLLEQRGFDAGQRSSNVFDRNFGYMAGKILFGKESFMMRNIMSGFNNFAHHYFKTSAKSQYAFIGQRLSGGNVSSAGSYLVGERGPEIFTPSQVGKISPSAAHENKNIYINLNITTPDVKNFYKSKNKITDEILRKIY